MCHEWKGAQNSERKTLRICCTQMNGFSNINLLVPLLRPSELVRRNDTNTNHHRDIKLRIYTNTSECMHTNIRAHRTTCVDERLVARLQYDFRIQATALTLLIKN